MGVECPECAATVLLNEDAELGEIVTCSDCGADLEVIEVKPIKLAVAPGEEEDWGE